MSPILAGAIDIALVCYALAMAIALVRLLRGPSAEDRVLEVGPGLGSLTLGLLATGADVVAVEARLHAGGSTLHRHPVAHENTGEQRVVSLTQRRLRDPAAVIAGLPPDRRPLPTVTQYDELLRRRVQATDEREGTTDT